jgi:hypothetical protein
MKLMEFRAERMRDGIDLTTASEVERIETALRTKWDSEASTEVTLLDVELQTARALVDGRIAKAGDLPATIDPLTTATMRQMEELTVAILEERFDKRAGTVTLTEAVEWYGGSDEST